MLPPSLKQRIPQTQLMESSARHAFNQAHSTWIPASADLLLVTTVRAIRQHGMPNLVTR